jgi:predicted RNA methylase
MTQSPANKFRKSASGLQKQIDQKRAPRLTNTAKRMREWESAIQDALHMELLQDKLNALAGAWDNITLPLELSTIKDMAQVECLLTLERAPINPNTDSYKRMERAELLDPDKYTVARNTLLALGNQSAGAEDKSIQLKRAEMDVDNSRIMGYFPTPEAVILEMLSHVNMAIESGDHILEPSAGKGSIADVLQREYPDAVLHCVEWNYDLRKVLEIKDYTVICDDIFDDSLTAYHRQYKLIVMNPPWGKEYGAAEDARHILHCYEHFLADDGQLISLCSTSAAFNQNKDYAKFREFMDERGYFVDAPQGAFKNADRSTGTSVKIVVLDKRSDERYKPATIIDTEPAQGNAPAITEGEFIANLEGLNQDIHEFLEAAALEPEPISIGDKIVTTDKALKRLGLPSGLKGKVSRIEKYNDGRETFVVDFDDQHISWDYVNDDECVKVEPTEDPAAISETIIRDLEEAIDLMKQIHEVNKREATTAWVKALNDKARRLDAHYTLNQHIPNERLDAIVPIIAADEIREWKELAKTDPVEWYQQQNTTIEEETVKPPLHQVQNSPIDEKPKLRQLEMF